MLHVFIPSIPLTSDFPRAMLHDPEVYPDPHKFDPARFIAAEGREVQRDPRHASFGYGRRRCPGLHLAEASLFICIAMALATFNMEPVTENGVPVIPSHENTSGTIRQVEPLPIFCVTHARFYSHTPPFKIDIKPRSQKALSLLTSES
jgi:hypothetical protein